VRKLVMPLTIKDKNSEKTCYAPDNQVNEKPVALVASVTTFI